MRKVEAKEAKPQTMVVVSPVAGVPKKYGTGQTTPLRGPDPAVPCRCLDVVMHNTV